MSKEELKILNLKKEASKKLLNAFNDDMFSVQQVERNLEVFKNVINTEFYKLKSTKKVKDLKIHIVKSKEKTAYDAKHNEMLRALSGLPIFIAEAVLNDFIGAINGEMVGIKMNKKFKELNIRIRDEKSKS